MSVKTGFQNEICMGPLRNCGPIITIFKRLDRYDNFIKLSVTRSLRTGLPWTAGQATSWTGGHH